MKGTVLILTALVSVSFANEGLARQKGCMACHDVKVKKVGPSYTDIAKRYADKEDVVEYLAGRIKKGSKDTWGHIPMPPHNLTDAEARVLAQWIMSFK